MAIVLISDLHLNPRQPAVSDAFLRFLASTAQEAEALYILGDFFDAWIGDDEDHPFVTAIKQHLRNYSQRGHGLFIQRGNRDFLLGNQFGQDTHSQLLGDESLIPLAGETVLVMHGDSLCIDDQEYMAFRAMVRSPVWQAQVLALPLAARRQMAQDLRAKSQSMNAMKAEDIMDVSQAEVERKMREHQVSTLIHGHTHRPAVHQFTLADQPATRLVLGDWGDKGWFIRADNELTLHNFAI